MDFHFQKDEDFTLQKALYLEWLETNGLGGYSSSSILNCNTRKYHGLLVSNLLDPAGKYVLLSQIEDIFSQDSHDYPLSAREYEGFLQSESFSNYKEFSLTTHPKITYQFDKTTITKELLMLNQENTILIKYKKTNNKNQSKITIKPLVAFRNFHELSKENGFVQSEIEDLPKGKKLNPYHNMPSLFFQTNATFEFLHQPTWYKNVAYSVEKQRGFDHLEDLFSPGIFVLSFPKNNEIFFSCSTQEQKNTLSTKWKKEIDKRENEFKKLKGSIFQKHLKKTAFSFIQKNPRLDILSVNAGYHWFTEFGRDTMISLPGLTLYSGLESKCLSILEEFSKHEYQGLLPNVLGETPDKNLYNSVDTSLWFAWAIQQYYIKTKDIKTVLKLFWMPLNNIFSHYKNGTLFDIKMQENGLLKAGTKDTNITWMDTKINHTPVTPRNGFAVEINALWYNMLCFIQKLAQKLSDPIEAELKSLIESIPQSFREMFWDENLGYLKDYVNEETQDTSIRPNQIFAVSLPNSPITNDMAVKVVKTVKEHLFTPYGLRTLSQQDLKYKGHYSLEEGFNNKELAYHNGTVWPWLLAHFGEALFKINTNKKEVINILNPCLKALQNHLYDAGIGCISEIFDGDEPHYPNGCISQAFSTSEILRLNYILNFKN